MPYHLTIFLSDNKLVRIGEYNTKSDVEAKIKQLLRSGYRKEGKLDSYFYPPHSIIKFQIGKKS